MTQKFYLRSIADIAPWAPTPGDKSTALSTGVAVNTQRGRRRADNSGSVTENTQGEAGRLLATKSTAGSHVSNYYSTNATTSLQSGFIARFTSDPVQAGTYGNGTWTMAMSAFEDNAAANGFFCFSIYFWRPSTLSVVGYIYDSTTAVGSEFSASTDTGKVNNITGSNVTAQDGDVLVLEVWYRATQSMGNSYPNEFNFDGDTDPTDGVTTTRAASYINAPGDIPLLSQTGIYLVGIAQNATTTSNTNVNAYYPIGIVSGEVAIAVIRSASNTASINSVPSGYSLIQGPVTSSAGGRVWAYYKILDGSEVSGVSGAITWGLNTSTLQQTWIAVYHGSHASTPIDTSNNNTESATTSHTGPSITPSNANCKLVHVSYDGASLEDPTSLTPSGTYVRACGAQSQNGTIIMDAQHTSGSVNFAWTTSSSLASANIIIALKPSGPTPTSGPPTLWRGRTRFRTKRKAA